MQHGAGEWAQGRPGPPAGEARIVDFAFTREDQIFRLQVRQWLQNEITPRWRELNPSECEESEEIWAAVRAFDRKLASKGWYAPSYPREYGGIEATVMQEYILAEEKSLLGAPRKLSEAIGVQFVGPTIMRYGSAEQKERYVKRIGRAEIVFCLGYSEPQAGSDLGAIQTRASRIGDAYRVDGQKIFTTFAHCADFCWLLARTDPAAPKHKGLSLFIVDMRTPGITVRPLINILGAHSFNEVYFDSAVIPLESRVGEENLGWQYLMTALAYERSFTSSPAPMVASLQALITYVRKTPAGDGTLADDPHVRELLAEMATDVAASRLLTLRVVDMESRGLIPTREVSMAFVMGMQVARRFAKKAGDILGMCQLQARNSPLVPIPGPLQMMWLETIAAGVGGGSAEMQRSIIAQLGLGLPKG